MGANHAATWKLTLLTPSRAREVISKGEGKARQQIPVPTGVHRQLNFKIPTKAYT